MKTTRTISAFAAVAVLLAAGILSSAAASRTDRPGGAFNHIFSEQLHKQLNLQPDQERQWEALMNEEESLRKTMSDSRMRLHQAVNAEFSKSHPDLVALSKVADAAQQQIFTARKDFRNNALTFYSSLSREQQAVVINAVKQQRQCMERYFEKRHHVHYQDS
ncbi:MAG TPA: periplasmic heavy metal sensor [Burkholderiales bacterium]|nr:periplasmic heavy metal sensor [Burkholderiales bacterium]